jgi:hypothetical protein
MRFMNIMNEWSENVKPWDLWTWWMNDLKMQNHEIYEHDEWMMKYDNYNGMLKISNRWITDYFYTA